TPGDGLPPYRDPGPGAGRLPSQWQCPTPGLPLVSTRGAWHRASAIPISIAAPERQRRIGPCVGRLLRHAGRPTRLFPWPSTALLRPVDAREGGSATAAVAAPHRRCVPPFGQ